MAKNEPLTTPCWSGQGQYVDDRIVRDHIVACQKVAAKIDGLPAVPE